MPSRSRPRTLRRMWPSEKLGQREPGHVGPPVAVAHGRVPVDRPQERKRCRRRGLLGRVRGRDGSGARRAARHGAQSPTGFHHTTGRGRVVSALHSGQAPFRPQLVEPVARATTGIGEDRRMAPLGPGPVRRLVDERAPGPLPVQEFGEQAVGRDIVPIRLHAVRRDQRDRGVVGQRRDDPADGVVDGAVDVDEVRAGDRGRRVRAQQMAGIDAVAERVPARVQLGHPHQEQVPLRELVDEPARDVAAPADAGDQRVRRARRGRAPGATSRGTRRRPRGRSRSARRSPA